MTFLWPIALVGLLAIPVLAGLYVVSARKRRRDAARFANPALVPNLVPSSPGWRRYVAPALALLSLALLVVGVARPHVVRNVARDEATIVLAIDTSKARQLSLIAGLGLAIPETRIVHRREDIVAAAEGMAYPLVLKVNIGGSGAGIVRYDSAAELREAVAERFLPDSVDKVLLVQDYVPARGGTILRLETLAGRFLYAIEVENGGGFDLCPADACVAAPGRAAVAMTAVDPGPELIAAAERIAAAAGLDVGGIEVLIDDRDGVPRFYDINALSNFVANPLEVLGWDPHERLVDLLEMKIAEARQ